MKYIAMVDDSEFAIDVLDDGRRIELGGQEHDLEVKDVGSHRLFSLLLDHRSYEILIEPITDPDGGSRITGYWVLVEDKVYSVAIESLEHHLLSQVAVPLAPPREEVVVRAPMPGLVVSLAVTVGEHITTGQVLLVLESMKMENEVCAPCDGVVRAVHIVAGELVAGQKVLLRID